MEELARATEIIGYDEVVMLGYRDSGMPDTPANEDPNCFAKAPFVRGRRAGSWRSSGGSGRT